MCVTIIYFITVRLLLGVGAWDKSFVDPNIPEMVSQLNRVHAE